ncbi:hypothetical protein [Niabella ginsengisoli]|uniref:Uncharacterized protein n=1 Tax=Niabella ginsengisoli TaxID=522298 RepID=A0ABS9SK63_9BACT|nr:hypothetical protein [Niabella ginsengisoli]MCH5598730.1 hypothetical protein [Niabella ginsengisoli]
MSRSGIRIAGFNPKRVSNYKGLMGKIVIKNSLWTNNIGVPVVIDALQHLSANISFTDNFYIKNGRHARVYKNSDFLQNNKGLKSSNDKIKMR